MTIVLLALALDPLSQQLLQVDQVVDYVGHLKDDSAAKTPSTTNYDLGDIPIRGTTDPDKSYPDVEAGASGIDTSMETAILSAMGRAQSAENLKQQLALQCPTGNCTWSDFLSLGVCHKCHDLTKDVTDLERPLLVNSSSSSGQSKKNATAKTLPNGHVLLNIDGYQFTGADIPWADYRFSDDALLSTTFGTGDPNMTNSMKDINTMIWSMSSISIDPDKTPRNNTAGSVAGDGSDHATTYWPKVPVSAQECALYYCVKSFETRVEQGRIHETIKERTDAIRDPESWQMRPSPPHDISLQDTLDFYKGPPSMVGMTNLTLYFPDDDSKPRFHIGGNSVWSINVYFHEMFSYRTLEYSDRMKFIKGKVGKDAVGYNGQISFFKPMPKLFSSLNSTDDRDISAMFEKLSISMTNDMRENWGLTGKVEGAIEHVSDERGGPVVGLVGISNTIYRTQWPWIVYHGALCIGALVFCLLTINASRRRASPVPAWKTSALAATSQLPAASDILDGVLTVEGMEKKARDVEVRLMSSKTSLLESQEPLSERVPTEPKRNVSSDETAL